LAHQAGRALPRLPDFAYQLLGRGIGRQLKLSQFGEAIDGRQQVVEVVRDAGCQATDCLHLLCLPKLLLQL
jgi:hypothetical protein